MPSFPTHLSFLCVLSGLGWESREDTPSLGDLFREKMYLSASKGCPFRDAANEEERLVFLLLLLFLSVVFLLFLRLFFHSPILPGKVSCTFLFRFKLCLFFSEERKEICVQNKIREDAIQGELVTSQIIKS